MKFTLEEFLSRLQTAIDNLPQDAFDSYVEAAANAKALLDQRIVETGKNQDGVSLQSIREYTQAWLRVKSGLTQKKIKKARQTVSGKLQSGKEPSQRTLNKSVGISGRYRGFVDLNYTGQMWADIKVLVDQSTVTVDGVSIKVGAEDALNRKKIEGNVSYRGDFMNVSEDELHIIAQVLDDELQNKFDSYF